MILLQILSRSFAFTEYNLPRGVAPRLPVVPAVRDVQLLPQPGPRARLQPVQPDRPVRRPAPRHHRGILPHTVGNQQEDTGKQRCVDMKLINK